MSAYAVIACDFQHTAYGRCMTEDSPPGEIASPTAARRRLKTEGWRRTRDGRDLCPEHATDTAAAA